MHLKKENAQVVVNALGKVFKGASIRVNGIDGDAVNVTATIQGKLDGKLLMEVLTPDQLLNPRFSIYRSGTGLTLKFE